MCFVVGSNHEGQLVPSADVVARLLAAERPRDPVAAARLAIHVIEEDDPRPQEPFVPNHPSLSSRGPSFDGARLVFLAAGRDPAAGSPRCIRYEVNVPQPAVRLADVSEEMGNDCTHTLSP